jgi:hypothetical protein
MEDPFSNFINLLEKLLIGAVAQLSCLENTNHNVKPDTKTLERHKEINEIITQVTTVIILPCLMFSDFQEQNNCNM